MLPNFFTLLKKPIPLLALGFGSGLVPKAPGTFGTVAAIPLYLLFSSAAFEWQLFIIVIGFLVGVYLCEATTKYLGVHDHPAIVWDEFVGFWLTMLVLPLFNRELDSLLLLLGFVFFRFFDILKPWPIRWFDKKIHGGFGIMFDDILAGIYAGLLLSVVIYYCY